jgi:hypothetical protein
MRFAGRRDEGTRIVSGRKRGGREIWLHSENSQTEGSVPRSTQASWPLEFVPRNKLFQDISNLFRLGGATTEFQNLNLRRARTHIPICTTGLSWGRRKGGEMKEKAEGLPEGSLEGWRSNEG